MQLEYGSWAGHHTHPNSAVDIFWKLSFKTESTILRNFEGLLETEEAGGQPPLSSEMLENSTSSEIRSVNFLYF